LLTSLSNRNPEKTLKYRAPDCVHYLHPYESIPDGFNGALYQEQYVGALNAFRHVLDKCEFQIFETIVDAKARKVALRLKATFDFKAVSEDEPEEKGYSAEYVYITEMDESGRKIVKFEEFLDPQRLLGYVFPKAERYNKAHGLNQH
jgi:hypothetical protein